MSERRERMTRSDLLLAQQMLDRYPDLPEEVQDYFVATYSAMEGAFQVAFALRKHKETVEIGDLLIGKLEDNG